MNKKSILTAILGSLSLVPGLSVHSAMMDNLREAQEIGAGAVSQGDLSQAALRAEDSFNKLPQLRSETSSVDPMDLLPASHCDKAGKSVSGQKTASVEKKTAEPTVPSLLDEQPKPDLKKGWAGFGRGYKLGVAKTLALWWNIMSLAGARLSEGDTSAVPGVLVAALAFPIVVLAAYLPMGIMSGIKGSQHGAEAPPKFDQTVKSPWGQGSR